MRPRHGAWCLKGGWLGDAANGPHETLLQVGFTQGNRTLIQRTVSLQLFHPGADLLSQLLAFVHCSNLGLRQIAVALDVLVLVIHVSSLQ